MVLQSQADDRRSPYYSMVHFSLMMPLAIVHTLVSHTVLWLRGGTTAPNIEQQQPSLLQVDRYYPWQEATYTSTSPTDNATASSISNGVAIVTGSNTGIGFQTARALVLEHDMIVILACRSRDKAAAAVAKINNELAQRQQQQQQQQGSTTTTTTTTRSGAKAIFVHPLDLSSFDSVREFARVVRQQYKEIHVLVNNAGRNSRGTAGQSSIEKVVVNGANGEQEIVVELELDLLFQSNFLGHFLLTRLLLHENAFAKNARIVNLSSVMHHFCGGVARLDLESAQGWKSVAMAHQPPYDTYSFSKLAAILFTIEHNRRHHIGTSTMIRSIAVNPGAVNSDIWRGFPRFMIFLFNLIYLSNRQGCQTSVAAAVDGSLEDDVLYLQPYKIPGWYCRRTTTTTKSNILGVPFPPVEALGPFLGSCPTEPRMFEDGGVRAAAALWKTCEELTGGV